MKTSAMIRQTMLVRVQSVRIHGFLVAVVTCVALLVAASVAKADDAAGVPDVKKPPSLPAVGEWDGVTAQATLEGPYEDPKHYNVPFGIISYFNHPWRGYMDTWPASRYLDIVGANWNVDAKYAEVMVPILRECGFRGLRVEIGWCNVGWDDKMDPGHRKRFQDQLNIFKAHGIRPLILLNAHHGVPCPMRDINVELLADVAPGDRSFKLKDASQIRVGYTGPADSRYIAAFPLITKVDKDGTCHLSAPMHDAAKAGPWRLTELKYQPLQGMKLKDGTDTSVAAKETIEGWKKYIAEVGDLARYAGSVFGHRRGQPLGVLRCPVRDHDPGGTGTGGGGHGQAAHRSGPEDQDAGAGE